MNYSEYWAKKTSPMASSRMNAESFYDVHAAELRALFASAKIRSVLEHGCGNGVLYQRLGFSDIDYTGVDVSESMAREFRNRYPDARVFTGNAVEFSLDRTFDLVFSNGLVQHLNRAQLERLLHKSKEMLNPGGLVVTASIPMRQHRWGYYARNMIAPEKRGRPVVGVLSYFKHRIFPSEMGYWYSPRDFVNIGQDIGLSSLFFGSMCYFYRFHAVARVVSP